MILRVCPVLIHVAILDKSESMCILIYNIIYINPFGVLLYSIYTIGEHMFETVMAVLIGLVIRDIAYEVINKIQEFTFRKREARYHDLLDEWLDEEI